MGRPKREFSGQTAIVTDVSADWHSDFVPGTVGVRRANRWDAARHWRYRMDTGFFDPLTVFFVLAELFQIDVEVELRAAPLTEHLSKTIPQAIWDSTTVGRVLADLAVSFELIVGDGNGLLRPGRDAKGLFYHLQLSEETILLAHRVLDDLRRLAAAAIANPDEKRGVSPLSECPSLRGDWIGIGEDED